MGGSKGSSDSSKAAKISAAASQYATDNSIALAKELYYDEKETAKPYSEIGLSTLVKAFGGQDENGNFYFDPNKLNQYTTDETFKYKDFQGSKFDPNSIDVTQDPSYQFRLNQGINALDKSAASKGMLLSGAQQKAINNYAQDTASQEYSNAYQRGLQTQNQDYSQDLSTYQQNMQKDLTSYNSDMNLGTQKYNQIASILGLGQTANNALASANANYANANTNALMTNANNIASANTYAANAKIAGQQAGISNLLGAVGAGSAAYTAFSDIRLKTNIALVGTLSNGLNVYDFDYIWGGARHRGIMAQEALCIVPDAVITTDSGYYMVDYSKIGA